MNLLRNAPNSAERRLKRPSKPAPPSITKCHAGLECRAIPVSADDVKRVVITGRAFVKSENYRIATGRAIEGDWQEFDAGDLFENVLIEGSASTFEKLSADIAKAGENDIRELLGTEAPGPRGTSADAARGNKTRRRYRCADRKISP